MGRDRLWSPKPHCYEASNTKEAQYASCLEAPPKGLCDRGPRHGCLPYLLACSYLFWRHESSVAPLLVALLTLKTEDREHEPVPLPGYSFDELLILAIVPQALAK